MSVFDWLSWHQRGSLPIKLRLYIQVRVVAVGFWFFYCIAIFLKFKLLTIFWLSQNQFVLFLLYVPVNNFSVMPGFKQYKAMDEVSCSRRQHGAPCEGQTHDLVIRSLTLSKLSWDCPKLVTVTVHTVKCQHIGKFKWATSWENLSFAD